MSVTANTDPSAEADRILDALSRDAAYRAIQVEIDRSRFGSQFQLPHEVARRAELQRQSDMIVRRYRYPNGRYTIGSLREDGGYDPIANVPLFETRAEAHAYRARASRPELYCVYEIPCASAQIVGEAA